MYRTLRICEIIAAVYGYWDLSAWCGNTWHIMNEIDGYWNALTSGHNEGSDGIVNNGGQAYSTATARYVILGADSHTGSTKSEQTRGAIEQAFDQQFLVPKASCTYSISPASASFPAEGGNGAFSVTTTAGCGWSALPSDGWVSVPGAGTGSGSGTVSFTVVANFSQMPRSATIKVQAQTFTITQGGATSCIYALSPSSVSVLSDATSGTVTVTTQAGCVWSATSNATWMTITAGSTGTGNGTFSYSVAQNTLDTARTGTVSVADRTFTITQSGVQPPDGGGGGGGGCRHSPCTQGPVKP